MSYIIVGTVCLFVGFVVAGLATRRSLPRLAHSAFRAGWMSGWSATMDREFKVSTMGASTHAEAGDIVERAFLKSSAEFHAHLVKENLI